MSKQPKKAAKKTAKKAAKKAAPKKVGVKKVKPVKLGDPADSFKVVEHCVASMKEDFDSFKSGNKSAGRRLRKSAQEIRVACGLMRKEIQNEISNM